MMGWVKKAKLEFLVDLLWAFAFLRPDWLRFQTLPVCCSPWSQLSDPGASWLELTEHWTSPVRSEIWCWLDGGIELVCCQDCSASSPSGWRSRPSPSWCPTRATRSSSPLIWWTQQHPWQVRTHQTSRGRLPHPEPCEALSWKCCCCCSRRPRFRRPSSDPCRRHRLLPLPEQWEDLMFGHVCKKIQKLKQMLNHLAKVILFEFLNWLDSTRAVVSNRISSLLYSNLVINDLKILLKKIYF